MKVLVISEVNKIDLSFSREKIDSIVVSQNIDVIVLLGGLFKHSNKIESIEKQKINRKDKRKKSSNSQFNEANNILSLNWLGKPVLVVPSFMDLREKKLIKQIQGQNTIFIRYLYNTSTLTDNWLLIGLTNSLIIEDDKNLMIENYLNLSDENILFLNTGHLPQLFNNKKLNMITKKGTSKFNSESFVVEIEDENKDSATIIDFETKSINVITLT